MPWITTMLQRIRYETNEVMTAQSSAVVSGKGPPAVKKLQRIENHLTKCSDDITASKLEYGNLKIVRDIWIHKGSIRKRYNWKSAAWDTNQELSLQQ